MKQILIVLLNLLVINSYSQALKGVFGYYAPVKADKTLIQNVVAKDYLELWQFPDAMIIDTARIEY